MGSGVFSSKIRRIKLRARDASHMVRNRGTGCMNLLNKLSLTSERGFAFVRGLMIAAAVTLVAIPVVFSGLTMVLALMIVVWVSVLVIPALYINTQQSYHQPGPNPTQRHSGHHPQRGVGPDVDRPQ